MSGTNADTTTKDPKAGSGTANPNPPAPPKDTTSAPPAGTGAPPPSDTGKPPAAKADGKKPDGDQQSSPPPPSGQVAYELKLPKDSPLKPEHVTALEVWAKEQGLSAKQAQAQLERDNASALAKVESDKAELAAKVEGWKNDVVADPELGGANLPRTAKRTKEALARHDKNGELTQLLEASGLGQLKPVVRFLESIGAGYESDTLVKPPPVPNTAPAKKDADVFYGG